MGSINEHGTAAEWRLDVRFPRILSGLGRPKPWPVVPPKALPKTVLLATARGAIAAPVDVVVSKILPFAITLQRGASSRSYAALGGSDDDEEEDPDDDGSVANLTVALSAAAVGGSDDDLDDGSLSSAADA